MAPTSDRPARRAEYAILAVLVALFLLSVGRAIDWGLPALAEEATPLRRAIAFWGGESGAFTLNPHFYNYPTLSFYVQFLVQLVMFASGLVTGAWHGPGEFRAALASDLPRFVLAARWTTATIAAATLVPVWAIGRRLAGPAGGIAAALILAASPVYTAQARFIGPDVPLAFASAMALLFILRTLDPGRGGVRAAAVWVGIAASCKYPGAWLAVPLIAALWARRRPAREWREALGFAFLAFLLTSPFVVLDLPDAIRAVAFERHHLATGHFGSSRELALVRYATDILPRALSWFGLVAAAAGTGFLLVRGSAAARTTALFALTALLFLGSWRVAQDRYALLLLPVLAALTGALLGRAGPGPALLLALVLVIPNAGRVWTQGLWRALPTTQSAASAWALAHLPRTALVAAEHYSIESAADSLTLFLIPFDSVEPHVYDPAYSLPYYAPFAYFVLSGAQFNRYLARPEEFPAQAAFYDGIARDCDEIADFEPGAGLTGSPIRVFRRREGTGAVDFRSIDADFYARIARPGPMARFLTSLGSVFSKAGRSDLALAAAEDAVSLAPDDPKSLSNLASLRARRGEYLMALKGYQRALEVAPDDPLIHYNLGRLYQGKELWSEALAAYSRALALNPGIPEAYIGMAICHVRLNQYAAARGRLEAFLGAFPADPRADQARAMLRELGRL